MRTLQDPRETSAVLKTRNVPAQAAGLRVWFPAIMPLLFLSPGNALALHWQAASARDLPGFCLVDPGRCGDAVAGWVAAADGDVVAATASSANVQQGEAIGEEVPAAIDSGSHAGSSGGTVRVFEEIVRVDGAPWIRLHFGDVVLARGDRIEVRTGDGSRVDVLKRRDFRAGRGASRYLSGGRVSVALFAGPRAAASRFVVTGVEYGYASRRASLRPRKICDWTDERTPSSEDRVCELAMQQRQCTNSGKRCGCPGTAFGNNEFEKQCPPGIGLCQGGTRDGLPCGDGPPGDPASKPCDTGEHCDVFETFYGSAFFVSPGQRPGRCLLTAGHNFFRDGEMRRNSSNYSTTLLCGTYGCGKDSGTGKFIECSQDGLCPEGVGDRPGEPCIRYGCWKADGQWEQCPVDGDGHCPTNRSDQCDTDRFSAPEQYSDAKSLDGVKLVDGEWMGGAPHDWAIMQVSPTRDHGAFRLAGSQWRYDPDLAEKEAWETPEEAHVTGHGAVRRDDPYDHNGEIAEPMEFLQQRAFGNAKRDRTWAEPDRIQHLIDTMGGNSGSPLLRDKDVVWGIHVSGPPGECTATPYSPNSAVYVLHRHDEAGGRALAPAITRNCPDAVYRVPRVRKRELPGERKAGGQVNYEIRMSGTVLATAPFTLRDSLPAQFDFDSVSVWSNPPEALLTPDAVPDANGVLHLDIAAIPDRKNLLVYLSARLLDDVATGTVVANSAEVVDSSGTRLAAGHTSFAVTDGTEPLALTWSPTPPPRITPSDTTFYKFGVAVGGLFGAGTLVMDFCADGSAWMVEPEVMLGSGLTPAQKTALDRSFTDGCRHTIGNVPAGISPPLLLTVKAALRAGTPGGSLHKVTATLTDAGRAEPGGTLMLSATVTAR